MSLLKLSKLAIKSLKYFEFFYIVPYSKKVGNKFFEWPEDERHKIIHGDALKYVQELVQKHAQPVTENKPQETEEETKTTENTETQQRIGLYDIIIVDINDSSAGSKLSPPRDFIEAEFLKNIKSLLTESGVLMMNIIPSEKEILDGCMKDLNKVFDIGYLAKAEGEVNYVAFLLNTDLKRDKSHDGQELLLVEEGMIPSKKELEVNFKGMVKSLGVKWDATMNLDQYCGELVLKFPQMRAGAFTLTNVHVAKDGAYVNKTKEMYLEDKEKVDKSQRRKKKNKKR